MFSTFFWWYRDVFLMSDEMFLIVWSLFTMSLTVDFYSSTTYFSAKISVGKQSQLSPVSSIQFFYSSTTQKMFSLISYFSGGESFLFNNLTSSSRVHKNLSRRNFLSSMSCKSSSTGHRTPSNSFFWFLEIFTNLQTSFFYFLTYSKILTLPYYYCTTGFETFSHLNGTFPIFTSYLETSE